MASVRVEGFPSPDAKTKMEAMVKGESEKILADLNEDERQDREIAFGAKQLVVHQSDFLILLLVLAKVS